MAGAPEATIEETRRFLTRFATVEIDAALAEEAVYLRRTRRIRLPDALIWASALSTGRLLVARDRKGFPQDDPGVRFPYTL